MSDFGQTVEHAGRKDHRCEWCGENIPKGEIFAHFKGMWEGDFQNWRMHLECYSASSSSDYLTDGFTPYQYQRGQAEKK